MTNLQLTFFPYALSFKKPFQTAKGKITKRKGFILSLENQDGQKGIGDAAPFPEFGSEKYEETENALKNLKIKLKIDIDNIFKSIDKNLKQYEKLPALRHGLEQAILNLICKEKNESLDKILDRSVKNIIKANAVIGILSLKKSVSEAVRLVNEGYTTLKLKIGRDDFKKDINVIQEIKKAVNNEIQIRVDVNGKWKFSEAKRNIEKLKEFKLEYIEQPVKRIADLAKLNKFKSVPIAADESCRNLNDAKEIIKRKAASVLILKPMMIGGLIPTLEIIDKAKKKNIKCIITSSFESAIGRSSAVFAASVIEENYAHGLGTAQYFKNDIIEDPFPVKNGNIYLYP